MCLCVFLCGSVYMCLCVFVCAVSVCECVLCAKTTVTMAHRKRGNTALSA